jgi:hypothetical protein
MTDPIIMAGARIAEIHGDVTVDAVLAAILRHHTGDAAEFAAALEFCRSPATMRQLAILFAHMGDRLPIIADDIVIERRNKGKVLRCEVRLDLHTRWVSGRLRISGDSVPETLTMAVYGRPLRTIVDHPYIPEDLNVLDIERRETWHIVPVRRRQGAPS